MTEEIRRACRLAIDAGYRNIDIDSSTLVDLSKPTVDAQQRENYVRAAELTAQIYARVPIPNSDGKFGRLDAVMVPIENSVEGGVSATLDALSSGDPLVVVAEVLVPVPVAVPSEVAKSSVKSNDSLGVLALPA